MEDIRKQPKAFIQDKKSGKIMGTNIEYAKKLEKKGFKIVSTENEKGYREKMREMMSQKVIY